MGKNRRTRRKPTTFGRVLTNSSHVRSDVRYEGSNLWPERWEDVVWATKARVWGAVQHYLNFYFYLYFNISKDGINCENSTTRYYAFVFLFTFSCFTEDAIFWIVTNGFDLQWILAERFQTNISSQGLRQNIKWWRVSYFQFSDSVLRRQSCMVDTNGQNTLKVGILPRKNGV